jgi:hypothetical protein
VVLGAGGVVVVGCCVVVTCGLEVGGGSYLVTGGGGGGGGASTTGGGGGASLTGGGGGGGGASVGDGAALGRGGGSGLGDGSCELSGGAGTAVVLLGNVGARLPGLLVKVKATPPMATIETSAARPRNSCGSRFPRRCMSSDSALGNCMSCDGVARLSSVSYGSPL